MLAVQTLRALRVLGESLRESGQLRAACCAHLGQFRPKKESAMYSTKGRPRRVTDAQVAALLEWKRTRKTLAQLARELGIGISTASYVIKHNGEYKQPSPELREAAVTRRRRRLKRLAQAGWL